LRTTSREVRSSNRSVRKYEWLLRKARGRNLATEMKLCGGARRRQPGTPRGGRRRGGGDVPAQVEDLAVRVAAVHDARQVEHLGAVVHLGPEALFEALLLRLERRRRLDEVKVREDGHELGHAVRRERRQGLESFLRARKESQVGRGGSESRKRERTHHLEPEAAVDHEEDEVGDLGRVDHGAQVVGDLDEGEAAGLACERAGRRRVSSRSKWWRRGKSGTHPRRR